ncbi:ATP-dependent Clp protease proteolytic subunit [Streptomyces sp. NPDC020801]|uniref:ATP-dependent Clp protease proteolytic subunit n=1 Tax=unclassified Streptomyces TaxID=2593676 RepID=UPI0037B59CBD
MTRASARHVLPGSTERTSAGHRTLDPCAKLLEERIVVLGTPIDDTAANDVVARFVLLEHQDPGRDISLYIDSPGGPFEAMAAVHDTMRFVGCDVETVCVGRAASTAAVLLAAGTPGKRYALPGARVVLQQPSLPEPVCGQTSDLAVRAEELLRVRARLADMLVRHTGRTREQVRADLERERVLDAAGALEYGLVDRVVPHRAAPRTEPDAR